MNMKNIIVVAGILTGLVSQTLYALEVDREVIPRVTLGGRILSTLDAVNLDTEPEKKDGINLSDSLMLLRFDKRMYETGVAGGVIGFKEEEGQVVFHQLNVFYWNRDFRGELGRTRLQNTLIEFPVLRDEDLLSYTHVGNASSDEEFGQLYGEQAAFDWYLDRKIQRLSLWTGTRGNGKDPAFANAPDGFDSAGAGYVYQQPEDLRYVKWIRHAGVLIDRQKTNINGKNEWMTSIIGGIELNLNMNPLSNWSLGVQAISNSGIDSILSLASVSERAASKSQVLVTSIRYTGRPKLLSRWQAAITVAYKDYSDVGDASQSSIVPNLVYRIGQGVDVFAQYIYTDFGNGLGGGSDSIAQIGVAFSLDAVFNDNIGERDSILNLEHGYIK